MSIRYTTDKIIITDDVGDRPPIELPLSSTSDEVALAARPYHPQDPPEPAWEQFAGWLFTYEPMRVAMESARANEASQGEPATTSLPVAMEAARTEKRYTIFAVAWNQFLTASGMSAADLGPIIETAQNANLPHEFIDSLTPLEQ